MAKSKIWVFNYDFEFELAKANKVKLNLNNFSPWYFLNRSSNILLPLAHCNDLIICYQEPDLIHQNHLKTFLGHLPEFLKIKFQKIESNSIIDDYFDSINNTEIIDKGELSPWGYSIKAIELAKKINPEINIKNDYRLIKEINSKKFSTQVRKKISDFNCDVTSKIIDNKSILKNELDLQLKEFYQKNSDFYIKNYFGVSGKLTDLISSTDFSDKKLNIWKDWIKKSQGILLEKKQPVLNEWSLHFEINSEKKINTIGVTKLFSNNNGSYLGNLVSNSNQDFSKKLSKAFRKIPEIIKDLGYIGPISIDLIETKNNDFKLIEINSRLSFGRLALNWQETKNQKKYGLLINLFEPSKNKIEIKNVIEYFENINSTQDISITLINFSKRSERTHSTIFIRADKESECLKVVSSYKDWIRSKLILEM